jgi:hypothetical protein
MPAASSVRPAHRPDGRDLPCFLMPGLRSSLIDAPTGREDAVHELIDTTIDDKPVVRRLLSRSIKKLALADPPVRDVRGGSE